MCSSASVVPFYIYIFCSVFTLVFSGDSCPVIRYTGKFKECDHVKNHALLGRSYRNLTTNTVQECFSVCVQDCRCVSYQLSGRRCELIDEDRHTTPDLFKPLAGYKYYELKQKFKQDSIGNCQCINGCCRYSQPCLNGGTCIETCLNVTHKFQCKCPQGFGGRVCEIPTSCAAYSTASVPNIYPIQVTNGRALKVYRDTMLEPGMVWTLIESFAFSEREKYRNRPLTKDFPSNEERFNWKDYRLSRSVMQYIRSNATHWRATCNFNTDGLVETDYVKGLLSDLDIMTYSEGHGCFKVLYINIREKSCQNCTSHFRQQTSLHIFIDSRQGRNKDRQCSWNGQSIKCDKGGCDFFGKYSHGQTNPAFRCSTRENSTTQWWLGIAN